MEKLCATHNVDLRKEVILESSSLAAFPENAGHLLDNFYAEKQAGDSPINPEALKSKKKFQADRSCLSMRCWSFLCPTMRTSSV